MSPHDEAPDPRRQTAEIFRREDSQGVFGKAFVRVLVTPRLEITVIEQERVQAVKP